jgi:histidine triad (HIT) family protein
VTEGHILVIPKRHVRDALHNPDVTARTMQRAAELGACRKRSMNLITSVGAVATQTVFHLHIHLVPRREGDGLQLPWGGQR